MRSDITSLGLIAAITSVGALNVVRQASGVDSTT